MAIHAKCPNPKCGKAFNLKTELAGKTVTCDACQQAFQVPLPKPVIASGEAAKQPYAVPPKPEPPTPKPADPLVGQKLGHYRVEAKVGAGGMATVYRGCV